MGDQLVRAITKDGMVKAVAVSTRELTERARQIHRTLPTATAALGRTLAAASMMGNALKGDGASLTLRVQGGGPLGILLAVSDNQGNVRGTVDNPAVDVPLRSDGKLDVGAAVGSQGTLTVIRDLHMKDPYVGSVGLLGGEIAEDLAAYFVESEQIPTACGLGVLVDRDQSVLAAGGYLIQLLPGAGEDVVAKVEGGVMAAGSVTGLLSGGAGPEEMLRQVLSDFELEILECASIEYRCDCSRDRMERALISLGPEELRAIIDEQGGAELTCRFCDNVQTFTKAELGAVLGRTSCAMLALTDAGFGAAIAEKLALRSPEQYGPAAQQLRTRADRVLLRQREQRRHEKNLRQGKAKPWAPPPSPPKEDSSPPRRSKTVKSGPAGRRLTGKLRKP